MKTLFAKMKVFFKGITVSAKVTVIVLIIILVNTVSIGILSYVIHRNDSIQASKDKAMAIAKSAAMSVPPDEFLDALETGVQNGHYEHLQKQFVKVKADENLLYFYAGAFYPDGIIDVKTGGLLVNDNGEKIVMRVYMEGGDPRFPLGAPIREGMFYYEYPSNSGASKQVAFDAFNLNKTVVSDIYGFNVAEGTLSGVAAYSPILGADGNPAGLVGVLMPV